MFDISSLENNAHTFVIAEAGSNWKCGNFEDDLKQAQKLIDIAIESGADAVKFQTYFPDKIVSKVEDPNRHKHFSKFSLPNSFRSIFFASFVPKGGNLS